MLGRKSKDELKNGKKVGSKKDIAETIEAVDEEVTKKKSTKKTTKKAVSSKNASNTKTANSKEVKKDSKNSTKEESKKESKKVTKKITDKKKTSTKKVASSRAMSLRDTSILPDENKKAASKTTSKKEATPKKASPSKKQVVTTEEYYDLPYRYNQTVVKILAQTPTMLFIYWDISDEDRNAYIQEYGESFFNETKPVLIITNKTMNYTFEVEINDFANSWYLPLNDPDCDYSVELGRKPKYSNQNIRVTKTIENNDGTVEELNYYKPLDNYFHICTSNDMEMPNNRILFDKLGKSIFFKNVKNNFIEERSISSLSFITNLGKVYNVYDLYRELYKDEFNLEDLSSNNLKLNLSSSNSSTFM